MNNIKVVIKDATKSNSSAEIKDILKKFNRKDPTPDVSKLINILDDFELVVTSYGPEAGLRKILSCYYTDRDLPAEITNVLIETYIKALAIAVSVNYKASEDEEVSFGTTEFVEIISKLLKIGIDVPENLGDAIELVRQVQKSN